MTCDRESVEWNDHSAKENGKERRNVKAKAEKRSEIYKLIWLPPHHAMPLNYIYKSQIEISLISEKELRFNSVLTAAVPIATQFPFQLDTRTNQIIGPMHDLIFTN